MLDFVLGLIQKIPADGVFIAVLGLLGYEFWRYMKAQDEQAVEHGPAVLTTIGVFGTFVGITIGLAHFNVNDISGSIPDLLEGLKTAFLTSICGIALAVILRWRKLELAEKKATTNEFTPEKFQEMFMGHLEGQKKLIESMDAVAANLVSNKDDSVSSILSKMRTDAIDQHKELTAQNSLHHTQNRKDMEEFIEKLVEQSTKGIIEQLEEVIRDFNEKIGEQFGQNFERFERALELLLKWQDENKQQVEMLTQQFKDSVSSQQNSAEALDSIQVSASSIPSHMDKLDEILKANSDQLEALTSNLGSFTKLREKAEEAIPVIGDHVVKSIEQMEGAVERASGHYQKLLTDSREMLSSFETTSREFSGDFTKVTKEGTDLIRNSLDGVADDVRGSSQAMLEKVRDAAAEMKLDMKTVGVTLSTELQNKVTEIIGQFERTDIKLKDLLNNQISAWDESMQKEVTRCIEQLAVNLTQVSGAFVQDYQQMVNQINQTLGRANQQLDSLN